MDALELLERLSGKTLDAVQCQLFRRILEAQRSIIAELEAANVALNRRNHELYERLRRFEAQSTRLRNAAHEVDNELAEFGRQREPDAK